MKAIIVNLVKNEEDFFFESFPITGEEIGNLDTIFAGDLWESLGLPVNRTHIEVEIVISVKHPKPRLIDILDTPEETKFQHYNKLDEFYEQGELIFKEKIIRNKIHSIVVKCISYGIITDEASLEKYFELKKKEIVTKDTKAEVSS